MVRTNWPGVVAVKKRDGGVYYYYRRRDRRKAALHRLPDDPRSPEFAEAYKVLTKPDGGRIVAAFSFDALIASYRKSSAFLDLAPRTRKDYLKMMDMLGGWLGPKDASRHPRPEVLRMQANNAHRPRTANYLVAVMTVLMRHAMDLGWRTDNPARGVRKLKTGPGYAPWTEEQIEAYRTANAEKPDALLIFELALGTGQRPSDLTLMTWSDYDGEGISVRQGKTGVSLWVPVSPRLRKLLDQIPESGRAGSILGASGYNALQGRFRQGRLTAGLAAGVSLHGLRKNAVIELAEAGATTEEIKALTGHTTLDMVELYSRKADQKRLARAARAKTVSAREQNERGKSRGKTQKPEL